MDTEPEEANNRDAQSLSLEQELPAAAIKRFAMLDSSSSSAEDVSANAGGGNRFDSSRLDWSRLLEDSNEATPTPPRPRAALSARLGYEQPRAAAAGGTPTPPASATAVAASSFRKLALQDSDASGTAARSESTPPPSRQPRVGKGRGASPPPAGAPRPPSPPPPAAAATPASSPANPPPPSASPTRSTRARQHRPTPLRVRSRARDAAAKKPSSASGPSAAAPATAPAALVAGPAAETAPLSPGVEYTTVPRWTKGMKKRRGVYVANARLADPTGLYERGMKGLQRAEAKREQLRAKLAAAEAETVTFHPVISPRANALKRGAGSGVEAADAEAAQQLRHRLQLLELPEEAAGPCRHSPRISTTSAKIVRECRQRAGAVLPAGERLYHDHFYRQQAIAEAQHGAAPPSAPVRTQREIDAHVAELYVFEEQRRRAIAAARAEAPPSSPRGSQAVLVDPQSLVARLTQERQPSPRRVARALREADPCTFRPALSADAAGLVRQARQHGLQRWVDYWCHSAVLSVAALREDAGPAREAAQALAAVLARRDPERAEWTVDDLTATFSAVESATVERLWRHRPPSEDAVPSAAFPFHPMLNERSAAIVTELEAEQRRGPAHERLFLAAKARQLSARQLELEAEQAALEAEQRRQARAQRAQAEWRAKEQQRLEVYREERALRGQEAEAEPPGTPRPWRETSETTPRSPAARRTSRRLRLPPSAAPESTERRYARPSPSPVKPAGPAAAAAAQSSKSAAAAVATAPSPCSVLAAPSLQHGDGEPPSSPATASPPSAAHRRSSSPTSPREVEGERQAPSTATEAPAQVAARLDSAELLSAAETLRQLLAPPRASTASLPHPPRCRTAEQPNSPVPIAAKDVNRLCSCNSGGTKPAAHHVDVVLACATLRDPATVAHYDRERLERSQKRQLRELGRLLYDRSKARADDH